MYTETWGMGGEVMKKLEGYETDALTALLLQYLDEDRERPFLQ